MSFDGSTASRNLPPRCSRHHYFYPSSRKARAKCHHIITTESTSSCTLDILYLMAGLASSGLGWVCRICRL
ncbi:hypothetical protein BDV12DRAFT_165665 [Aspergillus spectabilis]